MCTYFIVHSWQVLSFLHCFYLCRQMWANECFSARSACLVKFTIANYLVYRNFPLVGPSIRSAASIEQFSLPQHARGSVYNFLSKLQYTASFYNQSSVYVLKERINRTRLADAPHRFVAKCFLMWHILFTAVAYGKRLISGVICSIYYLIWNQPLSIMPSIKQKFNLFQPATMASDLS